MKQQLLFLLLFIGQLSAMMTSGPGYSRPLSASTSLNTIAEGVELPGQVSEKMAASCSEPSTPVIKPGAYSGRDRSPHGSGSTTPHSIMTEVASIQSRIDGLQRQLYDMHCIDKKAGRYYQLDEFQRQIQHLSNEEGSLKNRVNDALHVKGLVDNLDARFIEHIGSCEAVMTSFLLLHEDMLDNPLEHAEIHERIAQQLIDIASSSKDCVGDIKKIKNGLKRYENYHEQMVERMVSLERNLNDRINTAIEERVQPLVAQVETLKSEVRDRRGIFKRLFTCCYRTS